jgi:hypothetical protein
MDGSFRQQGSDARQTRGFLSSLYIVNRVLNWLTGLLQLTEKEQEDAGIYLGDQHTR